MTDRNRWLLLPRPGAWAAVCWGDESLILNPFDWTAGPFLPLYVASAVILLALGFRFTI
jgi:hypothetical protein